LWNKLSFLPRHRFAATEVSANLWTHDSCIFTKLRSWSFLEPNAQRRVTLGQPRPCCRYWIGPSFLHTLKLWMLNSLLTTEVCFSLEITNLNARSSFFEPHQVHIEFFSFPLDTVQQIKVDVEVSTGFDSEDLDHN
jgi:hypothetical protein